jgi:hypothetical protein
MARSQRDDELFPSDLGTQLYIRWRLLAERPDLDRYDVTKRARAVCSAVGCEERAILEVTLPHARHGTWTRALCEDHAVKFRRQY